MLSRQYSYARLMTRQLSHVLLCSVLLAGFARGQTKQTQPEKQPQPASQDNWATASRVPEFIAAVKSGNFAAVHVDLIARAGALEAIPTLKEQFVRVDDPFLKAKIAGALLILGEKDETYWNFLVNYSMPALESDAPDFMNYDLQGKSLPGPSPEFLSWAKARNLPLDIQAGESVYLLPRRVILLAWPKDLRAIPLLRQGLLSANYLIETAAAMGLAEIGDKDSIPLIIQACKKAPAGPAEAIAEALVYFDDNSAQSAVDQYIPVDRAKIYREARASGKKSPWYVPLN